MKTFNFYKDEKCTIWTRGRFQIEANTYDEAVAEVKRLQDTNEWNEIDIEYETLDETLEDILPENNNYHPTMEIFSEDTKNEITNNAKHYFEKQP